MRRREKTNRKLRHPRPPKQSGKNRTCVRVCVSAFIKSVCVE
uniref:MIP19548p n=1 Tax=Drosophila melanogaster TaxID=7227 RepID=D4G7C0_DROME|nr:MIP19548p [Drosophila melanogaster]